MKVVNDKEKNRTRQHDGWWLQTLRLLLMVLLFSFVSQVHAQESTTAYNFLRLPVSAHVAAVGGDNITLTDDDPALIFHNPALINGVSDKSINLNFMTYMEGAKTASAAFMKGAGDRGTWGVTAQYMDYGTFKQTTADGQQLGTFSARDIAVGGTFAYAQWQWIWVSTISTKTTISVSLR